MIADEPRAHAVRDPRVDGEHVIAAERARV
jgi:hypothetical protein